MCGAIKSTLSSRIKHPTAFSVLIRFWGTNQNPFSPINGLLEMPSQERMGCVCVTSMCGAKEKYLAGQKKSSLLHSRCLYGSGALIRINFDPQTAEKRGPPVFGHSRRGKLYICPFCHSCPSCIFGLSFYSFLSWPSFPSIVLVGAH